MKTRKALTMLQIMAAGGIIGTAIVGIVFNGTDISVGTMDLPTLGAIVGSITSIFAAKAVHFF